MENIRYIVWNSVANKKMKDLLDVLGGDVAYDVLNHVKARVQLATWTDIRNPVWEHIREGLVYK